jgi:hypothetical protein
LPGLDLKGIGMMLAKRLEIYRFLDITEVLAPVAQQPDLSHRWFHFTLYHPSVCVPDSSTVRVSADATCCAASLSASRS